ncbi:MAG: hypothetical protein AAB393_17435, partial [Bacteroidota bacterium]
MHFIHLPPGSVSHYKFTIVNHKGPIPMIVCQGFRLTNHRWLTDGFVHGFFAKFSGAGCCL